MADLVIVGAGPAGIRAAGILVEAGFRPVVIDEAPASGGQIYRRPPPAIRRRPSEVYGFEAERAAAVHGSFDAIECRIDYRPRTLAWSVAPGRVDLIGPDGPSSLAWDRLILATGAMDRVIPLPGWTLPGVFTLGGAQVALKHQATAIGRRLVFLGTGPLLALVAYQYLKAGVAVAAVLDTAPFVGKLRALPGLASGGGTFAKGLYTMARLIAAGVPVRSGVRPEAVEAGDGGVSALTWRTARGRRKVTPCDAVAMGFGLRSETQLADLCEAPFAFDAVQRQWLPVADGWGRTGADGIYLAGDGAGVAGALAAERSGARAAHAVLHDLGRGDRRRAVATLNRGLARAARFRRALDTAFPFPRALAANAADDLTVCRCEGVTAGEIRAAARATGDLNRVKAFTRVGMGRCQGRVCHAASVEILAEALGRPAEAVGRMRGQAPVKPLPLGAFAGSAP